MSPLPTTKLLLLTALALLAAGPAGAGTPDTAPDFSRPEPGEHLPGGEATSRKAVNRDAFSHPSANLRFEQELDFRVGNGFFKRVWVSAPSSTQAADGLGPLFNAKACQRCHLKDGRGHPPEGDADNAVSMFLRLSIPPQDAKDWRALARRDLAVIPEPTYGTQLQDFAIQGHVPEGRMRIRYTERPVELADGTVIRLRAPEYEVTDLGYGPLHPQAMLSPRVAPPMIGLGLLEAVPAEALLAAADPEDRDGDGISGRPSWVRSAASGTIELGRFGWKASVASVDEQNQGAFAGDIGISVPFHPAGSGECTERQAPCREAPDGNSPQYENLEAHREVTELVLFYARHLAVPARRDAGDPEVLAGKRVFYEVGCTACHTPSHRTARDAEDPALADQLIWPYTDLLLHDMGPDLADHRPVGDAGGREWRTPPLWGIGLTETVSGHTYFLHDGRARSLLEAILWHGGEAQSARDAVVDLPTRERERLLRFLESL